MLSPFENQSPKRLAPLLLPQCKREAAGTSGQCLEISVLTKHCFNATCNEAFVPAHQKCRDRKSGQRARRGSDGDSKAISFGRGRETSSTSIKRL